MKQPAFLKSLFKGNLPEKDQITIRDPKKISQDRIRNADLYANILYRDLDFETVVPKGVHIMFMSKEELEKISVVNIKNVEKREKFDGTIQDKKMYPPTKAFLCVTCQLNQDLCPGHLGRIEFYRPVINIWVYKYVVYLLESICIECGNMLISPEMAKRFSRSSDRLKKIATESKKGTYKCRVKDCPNKDKSNPSFEAKTDTMIKIKYKNVNEWITSTKILRLFQNLSNEDLEALGFSQAGPYYVHPKNFISESRAVLPVNHRPPEFNGTNRPNHLTTKYNSIVKINSFLRDGIVSDRINMEILEREITSISHRDKPESSGASVVNNDSSKNIDEMIAHKKGLIRTKAQGKRVDHTGRTVLGPGGLDIPFGWIKLPEKMRKFSIKERICDHNIEYFRNKINDGTVVKIRTQDKNIFAARRHANFVLKNGMVVERMTQDGDVVLFDRNPTLYKNSFMGYIAKFNDSLTIGLHSSVTKSHNADFDGDEGNIHVCPDYFSRAEIVHLSGSWNHVVAGQFSRPLMGLVFNAATSSYLMTEPDRIISDKDWDMYMKKVFFNSDRIKSLEQRAKKHGNDVTWKTGPVLFSALLPENFYYSHAGVVIKEGILVKGRIKKAHVGPSYNSIIHILYFNYGTQVVSQFLSEGQNIADMFLERIGFTVGYRDCSMPEEEAKVKEAVEKELEEAGQKIREISHLNGNKNYEIQDFYNESVNAILGNIKTNGHAKIADALPNNNSLKIMAECGAKGTVTDIAQVIGLVGQQFIDNKRPIMVFNKESGKKEGLRFLPYYDIAHENEPEKIKNRGFVDRPLGKGMRPGQYVAHMMASRVTLIQQALETSDTGQNQHNITKAMEDLRYSYNGTICNETGNVVQYAGGYDSYEPMEMMKVKIPGFGSTWTPIDIQSIVDMLNQE